RMYLFDIAQGRDDREFGDSLEVGGCLEAIVDQLEKQDEQNHEPSTSDPTNHAEKSDLGFRVLKLGIVQFCQGKHPAISRWIFGELLGLALACCQQNALTDEHLEIRAQD